MWVHNLNSVLFSFGPISVHYYGLAYLVGALITLGWLLFLQKKKMLGTLLADDVWDLLLYVIVGVLLGARLFMIFWQPSTYLSDPLEIFRVWHGGMSFHGGLVGMIIAVLLYSKRYKIKFLELADALSFPSLFALGIGRIANFINGELVGRVWDGAWCVVFPAYDSSCRHPWALYAAARRLAFSGGLFALSWLSYFKKKDFKSGFLFWNFVFWDGLGRFMLDFLRVDPMTLGLTLGQWFSLVMVIVGGYFVLFVHLDDWKKLFFVKT